MTYKAFISNMLYQLNFMINIKRVIKRFVS